MVIGATRRGLGDLLQIGLFNLHLDLFFEEILNLDREILIPIVAPNMARSVKIGKYDQLRWDGPTCI